MSSILACGLAPLARIYAWGARIWLARMDRNRTKLHIPVISIGNIAMGGTGKSPMCRFLAENLSAAGKLPVILSRGYKARPRNLPHHVLSTDHPDICGDEPLMLCRALKGKAHIIVDPDRIRAARWAIKHLNPDLFILDDGFQHLKVARDMDIVLLTPHDLTKGWNKVVPLGMWREDEDALKRADIFMVNLWGRDMTKVKKEVRLKAALDKRDIYYFDLHTTALRNLTTGAIRTDLSNQPYMLATGLANPEKVRHSLKKLLGYSCALHAPFKNHHQYNQASIRKISELAQKAKIRHIICTSKDAVKLKPIPGFNMWEAVTQMQIMENRHQQFINRLIK